MQDHRHNYSHMHLPPKRKIWAMIICCRVFFAGVSTTPQDFLCLAKVWCGSGLSPEVPRSVHGVSGRPESPAPGHRSLHPICIETVKMQVWCAPGLLSGGAPHLRLDGLDADRAETSVSWGRRLRFPGFSVDTPGNLR